MANWYEYEGRLYNLDVVKMITDYSHDCIWLDYEASHEILDYEDEEMRDEEMVYIKSILGL